MTFIQPRQSAQPGGRLKHAHAAIMEDRLQQAEQRLRDGDCAAAEEQAKAVLSDGPSYEAHMCGFLAMQCCSSFLKCLGCTHSDSQFSGEIGCPMQAAPPALPVAFLMAYLASSKH